MHTHNERGSGGTGVLGAVVVVILIGALAQLLGYDVTGLLTNAIHWTADKLGELLSPLLKKAQGRDS